MKPVVIERNGEPVATVREGDAIILFNFRADRMRQITRALTEEPFDGFDVRGRPTIPRRHDDAVRRDVRSARRLSAVHARARGGRGDLGARRHAVSHARKRRSTRTSRTSSTRAWRRRTRAKCASWCRARRSRRTISRPEMSAYGVTDVLCKAISVARLRFHSVQLREWRHGRAHRRDSGGREGGGDGG